MSTAALGVVACELGMPKRAPLKNIKNTTKIRDATDELLADIK